MLVVLAFLSSELYAFPELSDIGAVRSELQLEDNRLMALSDAETGGPRGPESPPPVLPVLRYGIVNLSEGDSQGRGRYSHHGQQSE